MLLALLPLLSLAPLASTQRTAILGTFDRDDLGWSWVVNQGVVATQSLLNTTAIDFIPNINGEQTLALIQSLAQSSKYNLIVGTTFDHRSAILSLAPLYPRINWVGNNMKLSNLTNTGTISTNTYEIYYFQGFFSGCLSLHLNNSKIGIVVPGSTYTISTNTNMFYVGMKRCNPQAELYMMWTGTLLNPDLANGASDYLVNTIGVGQLSQQQDDFTVPEYAISKGMLAQGTTGIDLATLYGQNVGMSVIRDWSPAYAVFVNQSLQGVWKTTSYSGSLASKMAGLSGFSYRVPQDVRDRVTQELDAITTNKYKPYCGDVWLPVNPANGNCLSTGQIASMQSDLPGIHYVGTYYMPVTEVTASEVFVGIFVSFAALGLVLVLVLILCVVIWRNVLVFRLSSPTFCYLILSGAAMMYVSVILRLPSQTDELCKGTVWLASLGFTFIYCYLMAKNYRIWRIFKLGEQCQVVVFTNPEVFALGSIAVAVDVFLLSLWIGLGSVTAYADYGIDGLNTYEYRMICTGDTTANKILIVIIAWKTSILLVGCVLAYLTRNVNLPECNESQHIALVIYTAAFSVAVGIPTILTIPYYLSQIALLCSLFLFCSTTSICILFVPKVWSIIQNGSEVIPMGNLYNRSSASKPTSSGSVGG